MTTRDKIKESAVALISERGFDGVSVRDIARRAGTNVSAVSYHFGGKEELLRTVVTDGLDEFRAMLSDISDEDLPLRDAVELFLELFLDYLQHENSVGRIIMSELSVGGDRLPDIAVEYFTLMHTMFGKMLNRGVENGEIRHVDETLAALQFISLPVHLTLARPIVEMIRGRQGYSRAFIKQVARHTTTVLFDGLSAVKIDTYE